MYTLSIYICISAVKGLSFSLEAGPQIYKKSVLIKLQPPYFGNKNFKNFWPHHRYTLSPKQAKIVLKSSLFEQNKHIICGHLVTPYILVNKYFMTPYFSKKLWPLLLYLGPPFQRKW